MPEIKRRIGGGRLSFEKQNADGTFAPAIEIGEAKDVVFKQDTKTTNAMNHDNAIEVVSDVAITDMSATISFKTTNHSPENLAIAMGGTYTTQIFAIGDTLPDFTVALVSTTLNVITGATEALQKGRFTFIESPPGGTVKRVFKIPLALVTSNDSLALMSKEFVELSFNGEVLKLDTEEYFYEYEMDI